MALVTPGCRTDKQDKDDVVLAIGVVMCGTPKTLYLYNSIV